MLEHRNGEMDACLTLDLLSLASPSPSAVAFAWYANSEMNACAKRAFWAERG